MDLLDISVIKTGDIVNFINNRNLFLGVVKKEYKGCLAITIDVKQSNYRVIQENQDIDFILAFKHEAMRCISKVIASSVTGDIQMVLLSAAKIVAVIERRQFKRLQTLLDIDYCFLPEGENYDHLIKIEPIWFKKLKRSFTVDISAGGICLITYENTMKDARALISFNIKNNPITALCSVVRVEQANDQKNLKTAMRYIDIDSNCIRLIDSYVLEKTKEQK
jgi:PilZ domain.